MAAAVAGWKLNKKRNVFVTRSIYFSELFRAFFLTLCSVYQKKILCWIFIFFIFSYRIISRFKCEVLTHFQILFLFNTTLITKFSLCPNSIQFRHDWVSPFCQLKSIIYVNFVVECLCLCLSRLASCPCYSVSSILWIKLH